MTEELKIINLTPLISMVSAGKTSFLNTIFDVDFLQVTSGIGTKFVNIIRYNPNVGKTPKFYHLIIKKKHKSYIFFKDINSEVIGKENIKKKNIEINEDLKSKNKINFKEIFYLLEIGESIIINDLEYLNNYDLVDIPGLSETIPIKSEKNNIIKETYNPDNENYLTGIFKIIKDYVNNGIIIFEVSKIMHEENYKIIKNLNEILKKPIENYLVLLNKIDESENSSKDLELLESQIIKNFPNGEIISFTNNTLVPCSTFILNNEIKMEKNFQNLMLYHFYNFVMRANYCSNTTPDFSFRDHLIKVICTIEKKTEIKKNSIIEIIKNFIKKIISLKYYWK